MIVAIYNVWDDWKLLYHSVKNMRPLIDGIIIVGSSKSNTGEISHIPQEWITDELIVYDPDLKKSQRENETFKRNLGLNKAKESGYTHFIMMDADEFYDPTEFLKEKERIFKNDIAGTVCRVKTYFKLPTLTIGYDVTLVSFIHKITPDLHFTWNTRYPFAFEGPKREIRIDPTRQLNINSGVEWSEITMHHMSWIRSDVQKKIRNSTAKQNIEKSTIVRDYVNAKEGYFCEFYRAKLEACENIFNIPNLTDERIGSQSKSEELS